MHQNHKTFIQNMRDANLDLQFYEGRWFWKGPAVVVDNLQDALSETKVPCKWDSMGLGYIVHPSVSCNTQAECDEVKEEIGE